MDNEKDLEAGCNCDTCPGCGPADINETETPVETIEE